MKQRGYENFLQVLQTDVLTHPIIQNNRYTKWFEKGEFSLDHLRSFTVQFSVFSNIFLIAQLKKMINAESLEEMRSAKEILANEIGVVFKKRTPETKESLQKRFHSMEEEGDPELVNTEGSVDGGVFQFRAAHFEWLLHFAKPLGLGFKDLGKRKQGSDSTLHFVDTLEKVYGSADFSTAAGGSFGVENWAAAGFWKELVSGLKIFREREGLKLPLGFFTWHDKVEDQHAAFTHEELKSIYGLEGFDEDTFLRASQEVLEAIAVFWNGLLISR